MNKKKVIFFLFALSGGGAERTVINIMNNLDRSKYEAILVLGTFNNNDYMSYLSQDIKVISLESNRLRNTIWKLRKVIKNEKPDILFSTVNPNNIILLITRILTFKKIPTIVREASNRTQSGRVNYINKLLTRILYNNAATHVIALSNGVREDLIGNFGILKSKITLIYNPIEKKKIEELSLENVGNIERVPNEKYIIAVGRLVEAKNFEILIQAFSIIKESISSKLLIVGKGPLEEELKQLVEDLHLKDEVIFLGFQRNPYKYMKFSDLFILSSKYEGFGHVITEAMTVGIPVISTDCKSGPNEIISHGVNGILVPVGDYEEIANHSIRILNNDCERLKLIENGFKRTNAFKAEKITLQYEKIFDKVVRNIEI